MREECPNCGADLPPGARVCPECGSDENTGWSDAAKADGLGLPDDSFDYDEFVKREFGNEETKPTGIHWFWWIVAVVVLLAFLFLWVGR
jgi:hypothetical protein